ncbi:MAG: hypothetical protein QOF78_1721 [Phycisphaerales bacterium]|jgi:hypothetical protein|nr:hypothetical protein [Phycisphaerales bacterium]
MTTTEAAATADDGQDSAPRSRIAFPLLTAGYFAILTVILFGALLWKPRAVVSAAEMDIDRQFYAWREFAFSEWRATGRPPLWNPYAFGGAAALGNFQYALLYPPNWLHLVLPTAWAINLIAALHVWLAGVLTVAWCRARGCSTVAALVGGTIFSLSGPYLLHLYAGHLTYLCVVAWAPLIFLAVDRILDSSRPQPMPAALLGAFAVAMQILGGYPQPAFYTLLAVVPYAIVSLPRGDAMRRCALIAVMYFLGASIAAAQLLPALDAARESVRAGAIDYAFATSYSLPPENLLTLIIPYPFGDDFSSPYTGRWLMWEMSLFVGSVSATLAACGLIAPRRRRDIAAAIVLVMAIVLAMGAHTPVFRLLYAIVPGVDRFRAPARFSFIAALMISALAAAGYDALRRKAFPRGAVAIAAGVLAAALFAVSLATPTIRQLDRSALIFAQLALVLLLLARVPRLAYLLPALIVFELWRPAARTIEWFYPRTASSAIQPAAADERVVTTSDKLLNLTTQLRIEDAWGYDPAIAARWADLVGPLLGADARRGDFAPTKDVTATRNSPIWSMLRVARVIAPTTQPWNVKPMPRVALLTDFQVVDGPAASLAAVRDENFDPHQRIILEWPPAPAPVSGDGDAGVASVVGRTTDSLTIDADLVRPAILLITDAYSAGWRAQPPYHVMPANHALRAIPLDAGQHHIMLEYRPPSVRAGQLVSAAGLIVTAGIAVLAYRRNWNQKKNA